MKNQMTRLCFVAILFVAIILASGCTSDTEYTPPSKVESTPSGGETLSETPTATQSEPETQPEQTKTQVFNVGDTVTDDELKVTVNDVKFVSKIDEQNNEFLVAEAPSDKQYAVIDITVENIVSDKTQTVSTLVATTLLDQDGYNYNIDFEGHVALDKSFKDGEILPGMKKRGKIAYLVPSDASDLKFIYKFDIFAGTTAVFDIK